MDRLNRVHLNGLRAVEAVARCGSLQKAADELGVSASAVSQQINNAERQLGRLVFERSRSGLELTEFGRQFSRRGSRPAFASCPGRWRWPRTARPRTRW